MNISKYRGTAISFLTTTALILVFLLSGCSTKKPSEQDARKVFENTWAWHIKNGMIEIISFKKASERTEERLGVEFYTIEYEAEIKVSNLTQGDWEQLKLGGHVEKKKETPEGDIVDTWGEVSFVKTIKGWKGEDGEIY